MKREKSALWRVARYVVCSKRRRGQYLTEMPVGKQFGHNERKPALAPPLALGRVPPLSILHGGIRPVLVRESHEKWGRSNSSKAWALARLAARVSCSLMAVYCMRRVI